MGDHASRNWTSADGLNLHYRDYPGLPSGPGSDRPTILCIPGLTRNARDFEPLADAFAGQWRILAVDLRGRGDSDYAKDAQNYVNEQYVDDLGLLLEAEALDRLVLVGTSMGGIIAMHLARRYRARVAAIVLNDIGPHIEEAGLARVRETLGQARSFPTWVHAARALSEQAGAAHPQHKLADWLRLSKRAMCIGGSGRISFDYDTKIAEPFMRQMPAQDGSESQTGELVDPASDHWSALRSLAGCQALVVRGEMSDILSPSTVERMRHEVPQLDEVVIARTGHAPTLEEPEALEAIARLLSRVA